MPSLADRIITALRDEHDTAATIVRDLTDDQLSATSGAAEWTAADVLSHLGSGAVITLAGLQVALGERKAPDDDFNQSVWDRWNAMSPAEQRDGFLEHDEGLVSSFEALDETQRDSLELTVGFLPTPLSVASFTGMRLHEAAQHGWDVRVAHDPDAALLPGSAQALAELFTDELAFMLGFMAKPDRIGKPVLLEIGDSGYGMSIAESVAVVTPVSQPTATFAGTLEAAIRLLAGRLKPEHTPSDLKVTGNVTLEDLRRAFPGI